MRNIKLSKKNVCNKEIYNNVNDFATYAILKYLDDFNSNEYFDCELILDQFNLDFQKFRFYLNTLEEEGIIQLNLIEDGELVLEIMYIENNTDKENNCNYFDIPDSIFNNIYELSLQDGHIDNEKFKITLFNYLQKNTGNIESKIINDMDEYLLFLHDINPADYICSTTGSRLNYTQFDFLFRMFDQYKFSKEIINLAIDYTISTNIYSTFNENYATKLLHNWYKNNINDIDKALDYIKTSKQQLQEKKNDNVFVEPVWNEENNVDIYEDDVFALLDKAYDE